MVPNAVCYVPVEPPSGMQPRPQSHFMTSQSQTIFTVFDACYDMPVYMQQYKWSGTSTDDMLTGLVASFKNRSDHFLGTLCMFDGVSGDHFWLVNGQQNLTTLQLILAFGMHRAHSKGASHAQLFETLRSRLWKSHQPYGMPSRWVTDKRVQHLLAFAFCTICIL